MISNQIYLDIEKQYIPSNKNIYGVINCSLNFNGYISEGDYSKLQIEKGYRSLACLDGSILITNVLGFMWVVVECLVYYNT